MKKALAITGVLLALTASLASAAGLNLAWDNCPSSALGMVDATDPCDNTGLHALIGTAVVPNGLTQVTGEECYVDMQVAALALPDFWHMEVGGCRDNSLLVTATFTGLNLVFCKNYWGTAASGGFNWQAPFLGQGGGPNRARLAGVFARQSSSAGPMTAGLEYYLFNASIDGAHAAPDPGDPGYHVCPGCQIPACWVFNQAIITQPVGVGDAILTNPATRNFVTWQGGAGTDCPTAVPAQRATWGQVKSLYR